VAKECSLGFTVEIQGSMYKSSTMKRTMMGTLLVVIGMSIVLQGCSYKIESDPNWSKTVEVQKNRLSDELTVTDSEAGWTLFSYYNSPSAQPLTIEKIDANHWIAVFEKPSKKSPSKVSVERIGDHEYKLIIDENVR